MSCSSLAFFHLSYSVHCHPTLWGNMLEGLRGSEHTMAVGHGSGLGGPSLGCSCLLSRDATEKVGKRCQQSCGMLGFEALKEGSGNSVKEEFKG